MSKITVHYGCGNSVALPIEGPVNVNTVLFDAREHLGYGQRVQLVRNGVPLQDSLDTVNAGDDLQVWDRPTQMA